jgi:hypothetical protein
VVRRKGDTAADYHNHRGGDDHHGGRYDHHDGGADQHSRGHDAAADFGTVHSERHVGTCPRHRDDSGRNRARHHYDNIDDRGAAAGHDATTTTTNATTDCPSGATGVAV